MLIIPGTSRVHSQVMLRPLPSETGRVTARTAWYKQNKDELTVNWEASLATAGSTVITRTLLEKSPA